MADLANKLAVPVESQNERMEIKVEPVLLGYGDECNLESRAVVGSIQKDPERQEGTVNFHKEQNHVIIKTEDSDVTLFKCGICSMEFSKRQGLLLHVNYHFKPKKKTHVENSDKIRAPGQYSKTGVTGTANGVLYTSAVRDSREGSGNAVDKQHKSNYDENMPAQKKIYECTICLKTFERAPYLKIHERTHTGLRPYKCNICEREFKQMAHLNSHKKLHLNLRQKCEICKKDFSTVKGLSIHLKLHTGEGLYKCDICDKAYIESYRLKIHKRKHTGEKRFQCSFCGKAFLESSSLVVHTRTHTGEKPYSCDLCGKYFANSSNLRAHRRMHTGEKPYKCDICGKCFRIGSSLTTHKRTHSTEKPYKCDVCEKTFKCPAYLKSHKRQHTGETPYRCDVCGESFMQGSQLKVHKRKHDTEASSLNNEVQLVLSNCTPEKN